MNELTQFIVGLIPIFLVYLLAFLLAYFFIERIKHPVSRKLFVLIHGVWLTCLTVFYANQRPLFVSAEAGALNWVHPIRNWLYPGRVDSLLVQDNIILIDVSHDVSVVVDSLGGDANAQPTTFITDRKKLARFLHKIAHTSSESLVDQVICDLTFETPDAVSTDDSLRHAFEKLQTQKKIIVAKSQSGNGLANYSQEPALIQGIDGGSTDVIKYTGETLFNYSLYSDSGQESLPYKLYKKLTGTTVALGGTDLLGKWVRETSGLKKGLAPMTFIPDLFISDEDATGELGPEEKETWLEHFLLILGDFHSDDLQYGELKGRLVANRFDLGQVCDDSLFIQESLVSGSRKGKRNLIFIGVFSDSERDIHQTAFGRMHGPIILINIYLNLINRIHIMHSGYMMYLLVAFMLISYLLLRDVQIKLLSKDYRKVKEISLVQTQASQVEKHTVEKVATKRMRTVKIKNAVKLLSRAFRKLPILPSLLADSKIYLLMFVVLMGAYLLFDFVTNLMGLELYLLVMKASLDWFINSKINNVSL